MVNFQFNTYIITAHMMFICIPGFSQVKRHAFEKLDTPLGLVEHVNDLDKDGIPTGSSYLIFNGQPLLKAKANDGMDVHIEYLDYQPISKQDPRNLRILFREVGGGCVGCWEKYYIVDCSGTIPVVSPGFDNGDTTPIKKVNWGKDKTTIYFRDNGKVFVWENFKLKEIPRNQSIKPKK